MAETTGIYQFKSLVMRPAVVSDVPVLISVIETVFEEYGWIFVASDEVPDFIGFESFYSDPLKGKLFSVYDTSDPEPEPVGCIALKYNSEGPYLSRVYLSQKYRGLGAGKWMTSAVLEIARSEGYPNIHLWTDTRFTDAHQLYNRLGFKKTQDMRSLHDVNTSFEWKMVLNFV